MKSEETTIALPASLVERMVSALEIIGVKASEKPRTADDDVRDMQEAARVRTRPWVIRYPNCESRVTGSKFDIEIQSTDPHPQGTIRLLANFKVSELRKREIYETLIGGQDRTMRVALMHQKYPESAGDPDGLDMADQSRVAGVDRHFSRQLRHAIWQSLVYPDFAALVGRQLSEVRHLIGPLPRYVVLDHDDRYPAPLPPQES